ncbi:mRNA-degrading endonuclease RelE of RelBE toxin-antitoxin system [Spirosoma oryzae]|uniref:mRNA-degrading endonuclease RelE of RelBE toxin-antitoxin system n=1 Tax=Spirosoma oryzae TaxID=1469603 RepID=A0A2T0SQ24_9BACT|nr:type II toxin-antitoxin system RelE/ParE family toxin [Spirosoma oryzae]PRY35514.1 mRNA-degrading endonuclease RelE of RelBE toxin-antitoxin system [Spirosoma oryzae]
MPNSVLLTPRFERRYKRFSKKFASLEGELDELIADLTKSPTIGQSLGSGLYKIRLAVKSKGKGKSGGFRIVSYLVTENEDNTDIFLITMYDKSEDSSIDKDTLLAMIADLSE